jgi:hypothetical protein
MQKMLVSLFFSYLFHRRYSPEHGGLLYVMYMADSSYVKEAEVWTLTQSKSPDCSDDGCGSGSGSTGAASQ